ncbi:hypothetical protein [Bifidobacterium sp. UTBIF-68]|uniref:hypothetical protein n=1 Tax=Bifidobacterium sp. UTBIF-68 TaxID=1465262 RepID=UPI00112E6BDE|nr:hypothetical protein [Bifidobacterium sp. UTBIF-68]
MTSNSRLHWSEKARHTAKLRRYAFMLGRSVMNARGLSGPVFDRCVVDVSVMYPRQGRADPANVSPVVKPLLDGLTDAGFWPDDDSAHVMAVTYRRDPVKSRYGTHMVTLTITEAGE